VRTTAPFGLEGPQDIDVEDNFTQAAFALTPAEPIAGATLPAEDGVYIIALKEKFPRKLQDLAAVRARVEEDYRRELSQEAALKAADAFHQQLTNGLAQGKAFTVICTGALVKPTPIPPFSASTRTLEGEIEQVVDLRQLQSTGLMVKPGQASGVTPTRTGAMVLFVRSRLPVSETKLKEELPLYTTRLRQFRQNMLFDEWLQRQFQTGGLNIPKGVETEM
jgi:hypothetical protein